MATTPNFMVFCEKGFGHSLSKAPQLESTAYGGDYDNPSVLNRFLPSFIEGGSLKQQDSLLVDEELGGGAFGTELAVAFAIDLVGEIEASTGMGVLCGVNKDNVVQL